MAPYCFSRTHSTYYTTVLEEHYEAEQSALQGTIPKMLFCASYTNFVSSEIIQRASHSSQICITFMLL